MNRRQPPVDRLIFPKWRVPRDATLERLCALFLDRCSADELSPKTERYYRQACDKWLTFCRKAELADPRDVSPDDLRGYKSWLEDASNHARGNNALSVATWLRGVRALFSWAEQNRYIEYSPFHEFKPKQPKLPPQKGFTSGEVLRMLNLAGRQAQNALRDTAILLLLYDTGMRRLELARLRLQDVIEDERLADAVTVHGKGDKYRTLEVNTQTQRALYEYLVNERPERVRNEAVFLARGSQKAVGWHALTPDGVTQLVERLARRAGITGKRLGPHTMRHGFAQAYLESDGARVDDLQILLGHESITMSLKYAGQAAMTARRAARQHSPVAQLGLHLGKRLRRGRPPKGS